MAAAAGGGEIPREQLLVFIKKQKETIKKLTDEKDGLAKQLAGDAAKAMAFLRPRRCACSLVLVWLACWRSLDCSEVQCCCALRRCVCCLLRV
jgi:hypothetical protein